MPVFCNPIYIVKSEQNCTTLESMHCIEHYGVVNVDAVVLVCINQIHHHIANIEFPRMFVLVAFFVMQLIATTLPTPHSSSSVDVI